jgi:hypothetical protein
MLTKVLQINISSGSGETRIRQAVIIHAFETLDDSEWPSFKAVESGVTLLRKWAQANYPERDDWRVYFESRVLSSEDANA